MTITIAGIDFDYRDYDERSDVLYRRQARFVRRSRPERLSGSS